MAPHLPPELWHNILANNDSLSLYNQRGTCILFNDTIERIFFQRHSNAMRALALAFRDPSILAPFLGHLEFDFRVFSDDDRVVYMQAAEHEHGERCKEVLEEVLRNTPVIQACTLRDPQQMDKCKKMYVVRGKRTWQLCTGERVPLFGLEVNIERMAVRFEWMPMYAALMRERVVRVRERVERAVRRGVSHEVPHWSEEGPCPEGFGVVLMKAGL